MAYKVFPLFPGPICMSSIISIWFSVWISFSSGSCSGYLMFTDFSASILPMFGKIEIFFPLSSCANFRVEHMTQSYLSQNILLPWLSWLFMMDTWPKPVQAGCVSHSLLELSRKTCWLLQGLMLWCSKAKDTRTLVCN